MIAKQQWQHASLHDAHHLKKDEQGNIPT